MERAEFLDVAAGVRISWWKRSWAGFLSVPRLCRLPSIVTNQAFRAFQYQGFGWRAI